MTTAAVIARERQLDWLLGEVLGEVTVTGVRPRPAADAHRHRWLVAALVTLAIAVAFGTALLRRDAETRPVQQPSPEVPWLEVHGANQIDSTPADARALRCFDFDDAAMALLPKFTRLERLDLSGMDVNEQGNSRAPQCTDAGLAHLGKLVHLRWLSLASCDQWKGPGLAVLEQLPLLEHLDLTHTCVDSPAIERLPRLASLRELSLSYCLQFHGRSLTEVAKIPGLRRLELRGCATVSAADVMQLAKLTALRHLDLRDCQGRYRGQVMAIDDLVSDPEHGDPTDPGPDPEPTRHRQPPKQDGIGITDATVAAMAHLELETLLLGGSESLTDAIGNSLADMTTLRNLDLSNLPKTTGELLAHVPSGLTSLALDYNPQIDGAALRRLRPLSGLRELGLSGLGLMTDDELRASLQGKQLLALRAGWRPPINSKGGGSYGSMLTAPGKVIASQRQLRSLDLSYALWVDAAAMREIARLPELAELNLTATRAVTAAVLTPLAQAQRLRSVKLTFCSLEPAALQALAGAHLEELDLYGSKLDPAFVREAAKTWPGCTIKLPDGQRYVVPR